MAAQYGYRVKLQNGATELDITTRITRRFGRFDIPTSQTSGSFQIPQSALNYFFYIDSGGEANLGQYRPELSISAGGLISWNWGGLPVQYRMATGISYGGY